MTPLIKEKARAISLRKTGKTYSEILQDVHVAKSTLSDWLKSVSLAKYQKQRITRKKLAAQAKAVKVIQNKRRETIQKFLDSGVKDIGRLNPRDLFILGIALYWAEGAKQKEIFNVSQGVDFTNSNFLVIKVFLNWLKRCCQINDFNAIKFELYIHESIGKVNANQAVIWWKNQLKLPKRMEVKIRFKRHKLGTHRHIVDYHGQFRIKVLKSTNLNRKIAGWTAAVAQGVH